jgi:Fe/S biogenesis protein NfuA
MLLIMTMETDTPTTDSTATDAPPSLETSGDVVMAVSEAAMASVLSIRGEEPDPDALGLRVEVTGSKGAEYTYDLCFHELSDLADDDVTYTVGTLTVVLPGDSVDKLRGAELDMPRAAGQGGLVIRNPNRADPLAGIDIELTGDIAEKVTQLLEQSINPSLASHGGFATLVGVDDDNNVYVTMGGGCQGCSASAMTLSDGIRRAIKEQVPEVLEVLDATDHAAGENPFYS